MSKVVWTPEMDAILVDNYWEVPPQQIADMIGGVSETAVKRRLKKLGLILPPEIIAERVRLSRFQPGQKPWNTGLKMSPHPNSIATQFKKGHVSANARYDGHVSYRLDKERNRWYCHIRVNGKYRHLQRIVWERANGPIPKGMIVRFINGNSLDCRLCNLELISRAENALRNTNRTKATEAMREYWQNGGSDKHIASYITKDKAIRPLLAQDKQLIGIKRLQLQLRRELNEKKPVRTTE